MLANKRHLHASRGSPAESVLLHHLADAAVGVALCDAEGRFISTNTRFQGIVAYDELELQDAPETQITHPDDRDAWKALFEDLVAGRRDHFVMEKRYRRRNGSVAWVRVSVVVLDGDRDRVLYLVEDISDAVTAAREAERFQQEALETREDLEKRVRQQQALALLGTHALLGVDLDAIFQRTCQMLMEVLELPNTKVLQLTPKRDGVRLRAGVGWQEGLVGEAVVSIGPDSQAGYTLMAGHPVVVRDLRQETRFTGPPLLHEHGIVSGMSVIIPGPEGPWGVLGVHDRKERVFGQEDVKFLESVVHVLGLAIQRGDAEERLRLSNESLEQRVEKRMQELQSAYDSLEAFSYTVAHDLRGPLRSMRLVISLTRKEADETMDERLAGLDQAAARMLSLVDGLLEFAHAGKAEPMRKETDIVDLVQEVAREKAQEKAQAGGEAVSFKTPSKPIVVEADPALVRIVLYNLLGNAWKFTSATAEPEVEFGVEPGPPQTFWVRDNGPGFDPKRADEIFIPFRRLQSNGFAGSGVGLATVKRIVERHGGMVWAKASPGQGATIYFTLAPQTHPRS